MNKIKKIFCNIFGIIQPGDLIECEWSVFEILDEINCSPESVTFKTNFFAAIAIEKFSYFKIDRCHGMPTYHIKGWKVFVDGKIKEIPKYRCHKSSILTRFLLSHI